MLHEQGEIKEFALIQSFVTVTGSRMHLKAHQHIL